MTSKKNVEKPIEKWEREVNCHFKNLGSPSDQCTYEKVLCHINQLENGNWNCQFPLYLPEWFRIIKYKYLSLVRKR